MYHPPTHHKVDEVLVEDFPPLQLESNEIAYIYYRNGVIEYEKIERGNRV